MRLRSTAPAVAASALLAALLAVPGQAVADASPSPTPSASSTDSASPSPTPSDSASPTATPTATPTPVTVTQPTVNLPWAANVQLGYGNTNVGILSFWAYDWESTGTATPVAVRLYPADAPAGAAPALTLTQADLQQQAGLQGLWYAPANLVLPTFGKYRVAVDMRDSTGDYVTEPNAGTISYQDLVRFTSFTATGPTSFDFDHRGYSVAGSLTVTDPRTGQATPFAGASVQLANQLGNNGFPQALGTVTTDANGAFGADLTATSAVQPSASYTPSAADSVTYSQASVGANPIYVASEQTRIRFTSPTDVNVSVGGTAVITGIVERLAGSTWKPAPGTPYSWGSGPQAGGTTDAQGDFRISISQAGNYQLSTANTGFLDWTSAPVTMQVHIPQPTSFTGLGITEDEFGEAAIDGHLALAGGGYLPNAKVYVQYSADGRNWHWIGSTPIGRQGLAGDEFKCFALWNTNANGYWRVFFPGNADWRPVMSRAFHVWRTPTGVGGGKPSTTWASKGQTLTFRGTVYQQNGSWHRLPHAHVTLIVRPYGSTTWYWVSKGWADAYGNYTLRGITYGGGTWAVVYNTSDSSHIDSVGPNTYVHVR